MSDSASFEPKKSSPLAGLPPPGGGISLEERPFVGKVVLRGDCGDDAFIDAVKGVAGCAVPVKPNTVADGDDLKIFWLGPNEWQVHCPEDAQQGLIARLRDALAGQHAAVVDVSDYYVVMRLSGRMTIEVLAKGTPLDLHARAFPAGRCAQTHFGHATVLLHKVEDRVVDLQARWSFAEYVWSFIVDGTREYRGTSA